MSKDLRDPIHVGEKIKEKPVEPATRKNGRVASIVLPHKRQGLTVKNYKEIKEDAESIMGFMNRINRHGYHGLSALAIAHPQIEAKEPKRFFVDKEMKVYYNPKIIDKSEKIVSKEQCLSWPFRPKKKITRFNKVTIEYFDEKDKKQTENLEGLKAIMVQHEIDHLNGVNIYG